MTSPLSSDGDPIQSLLARLRPGVEAAPWVIEELQRISHSPPLREPLPEAMQFQIDLARQGRLLSGPMAPVQYLIVYLADRLSATPPSETPL